MSTKVEKKTDNRLPTIAEIYKEDNLLDAKKTSQLLLLLNCNPPSSWIHKHPIHGTNYIPIGKIEFLLTRIFGEWQLEIKSYQLIANSVSVCVRLHYTNPVTGEKMFQDGIGASPLQTDKGAGATDFNAIKSTAVSMALPAAESYALKDAAEKIGKLFGKDIARESTMDYEMMLNKNIASIEEKRKNVFGDD